MKYLRISVVTTTEFADIVADRLFMLGSEGVSIKDQKDVLESLKSPLNWDYADESVLEECKDPRVIVSGFFEESIEIEPIFSAIAELRGNKFFDTGSLEVSHGVEDSALWENVWKQYYKPIPCGRVTVVPKWLTYSEKETISVFIDPGLAFGTGNHETTAMCAELLSERNPEEKIIADIGCGSGILGICALKLGAKQCLFVDIDENAIKASKENAEYNGVLNESKFVLGSLSAGEKNKVDWILANLTADILCRLKEEAVSILHTNGIIIMSGILEGYQARVMECFSRGFRLIEKRIRNDWHAMVWEKA